MLSVNRSIYQLSKRCINSTIIYTAIESLQTAFLKAMRLVPSTVAVVTTGNGNIQRGVTCSSFTSVSLNPPIVSFCLRQTSQMHDLLSETQNFIINILSDKQMTESIHFSKENKTNQFEGVMYTLSDEGHPILHGSSVILECSGHSVHAVGDHHVWYGLVNKVSHDAPMDTPPLLYYARTYRSVGDDVFMDSFETARLAYEDWTHEAHLRMAWNYIQDYGREKATPLIKEGIKNFNEKHSDKIKRGYHETVTMFFIHMICHALDQMKHKEFTNFQEFLDLNQHLVNSQLLFKYYSHKLINTDKAKQRWIEPDIKPLP